MEPITLPPNGNAPVIRETKEPVALQGVHLYLHHFSGKLVNAPIQSSRFTIDPDCATDEDRHAVNEIWFISGGDLNVFYDGTWHAVKNGDSLYFAPWRPHLARNTGTAQVQVFSVWWA
ncbi:cupin domain-containing protein [Pseudomonas fluorescens]|uniref:Cupin domain-containing protein n=2 Tax=Pseudomonas fluorescens group TaxID=136843 RepID=A0A7M2JGL6_PSEFL|nr:MULTISPECIES: cupin domain-containing protein [Pseudomonas]KAA6176597.1 cupin domain-containing protein [Pseudomonas veronii]KAA6182942.1 cupin domain-containing protein [Pseudomonas veronii]QOU08100.1 cupin domain-containing protein [Pseudomonas fluorescens]WLD64280.1 cupin domain-containing protein [Pseudomonas sp. OVF7]